MPFTLIWTVASLAHAIPAIRNILVRTASNLRLNSGIVFVLPLIQLDRPDTISSIRKHSFELS